MARLPNGAGSVRKLSGKRARPWQARGRETIDSDGKPHRPHIGTYKTKKEALEAVARYEEGLNPVNKTLEEMFELYLSDSNAQEVTIKSYRDNFKHLRPLWQRKFLDLKLDDYQRVFDSMRKLNKKEPEPLSHESKKRVKAVLSNIYTYAMKREYIEKNYSEYINLGKPEEKEEKSIFGDIQIALMFKKVHEILDLDIILILIYTGLRPGEILGLRKDNVSIQVVKGKTRAVLHDFGIKTTAGKKRIMPVADKILPFVLERYEAAEDYLFTTSTGSPMNPNYYRKNRFYPAMEELGFTGLNITPYSTRHTFASMMEKAKIDRVAFRDLMGHEKYSTSADNYVHLDEETLLNAVNQL